MNQSTFPTTLPKDELANVITHVTGLIICLIASPILIYTGMKSGEWPVIIGLCIFCLSMILVYASSSTYHAIQQPRLKYIFRIIDHICIYFLIVGTHTPLLLLYLKTTYGYFFLALLWILTLIGIIYKTFWFGKWEWLSLALYIAMGWSGILTIPYMLDQIPTFTVWCIFFGGLSYSIGVIFYLWEKLPYHHAIWHLFVMGGSAGHYLGLFYCFV